MPTALRRTLAETFLLAGRSLRHIPRVPEKLADVTIQPVIFIVLFAYVLGSAIAVPSGVNYREYLVSGIFATSAMATIGGLAVGFSDDVRSGIIDRLRALPIARISLLAGRSLAQLAEGLLGTVVLVVLGVIVGWGVHGTVGETAAGFGLAILWSFAGTWCGIYLGLILRDPEAAQTITFSAIFPLMFLSTVFVPVGNLPTPIKQVAEWNPISAIATALRQLWHNPSPPLPDVWPLQHPVAASLIWCVVLVAIFAPLAVRRYRRMSAS